MMRRSIWIKCVVAVSLCLTAISCKRMTDSSQEQKFIDNFKALVMGSKEIDSYQDWNTVGNATVPVSMIVVGVQLGTASIRKMLKNYKLMIASLVNVVVVPVLTFLSVNWLPITWKAKVILILAAAFPCAVVLTAMAIRERKNATLMAEGVALTTLLSVVTLPVCVMFLTWYYF